MNTVGTTSSDASFPRPRTAWWMVAVFCLAALVSYSDRLILGVLVDPIRKELAISDSQVSVLQGAAFALIYVLAGVPLGRLADRGKRLNILVAGATLWCIGVMACGWASGFKGLFAGRLLVGIGEAALAPAAASMIADAFPPARRGAALGVFLIGTVLGGPTAIAAGGTLLGAAQSGAFAAWPFIREQAPWRAVLWIMGTAGLLVPALCLTLREPPRRGGLQSAPVAVVIGRFIESRAVLAPLYGGMALLSVGDYGLLSWMPTLLSRKFALSAADLGLIFGLITSIAGVAGGLFGGIASDRVERRHGLPGRLLLAGLAGALGALAAALISGNLAVALLGLGFWTFASSVGGLTGITALQEMVPNECRGVAMALVAFCNTLLGLVLGPTLVALCTERLFGDDRAVDQAIAVVVVPAALLACVLFIRCRYALRNLAMISQ